MPVERQSKSSVAVVKCMKLVCVGLGPATHFLLAQCFALVYQEGTSSSAKH